MKRYWIAGFLAIVSISTAGFAQDSETHKWEIEGHGAFAPVSYAASADVAVPPPGRFLGVPGGPSRLVPSWYFGDGAVLLNQVAAALNVSRRMVALDNGLAASGAQLKGFSAGLRLNRRVSSSRFDVEFNLDYNNKEIHLTDDIQNGVELSRAAFITEWQDVLATHNVQNVKVTSSVSSHFTGGESLALIGGVRIRLLQSRSTSPFVTIGAGTARIFGNAGFVLTGNYQFDTTDIHISETDTVTTRYTSARPMIGLIGGGIQHAQSPRWGMRVDFRSYLYRSAIRTKVDTGPSLVAGTPPSKVGLASNPSIGFSNTAGSSGSLGSALQNFEVSTDSGMRLKMQFSLGIYRRF